MKASKPVEINAHLYNDLVDFLDKEAPRGARLLNQLKQTLLADSCADDGEYGECGTHEQDIEYWVDNFGPEGKVISIGARAPKADVCFPVCGGAQEYDYNRLIKVGAPATA